MIIISHSAIYTPNTVYQLPPSTTKDMAVILLTILSILGVTISYKIIQFYVTVYKGYMSTM